MPCRWINHSSHGKVIPDMNVSACTCVLPREQGMENAPSLSWSCPHGDGQITRGYPKQPEKLMQTGVIAGASQVQWLAWDLRSA